MDPDLAVIPVSTGNWVRHSDPGVVKQLLKEVGVEGFYRTDRDGTIELISNGSALWVKTDR